MGINSAVIGRNRIRLQRGPIVKGKGKGKGKAFPPWQGNATQAARRAPGLFKASPSRSICMRCPNPPGGKKKWYRCPNCGHSAAQSNALRHAHHPHACGTATGTMQATALKGNDEEMGAARRKHGVEADEEWKQRGGNMLRKMGWTEGVGLGRNKDGITAPVTVNQHTTVRWTAGLGLAEQQQQQPARKCWCEDCIYMPEMPKTDCRYGQECWLEGCHCAYASPAGGSRKEGVKPAFMLQTCPLGICYSAYCSDMALPSPTRFCFSALQQRPCCGGGGAGGSGAGGGAGWSGEEEEEEDECISAEEGEDSEDEEGMCGFSGRDCQELMCQGVKPWDDDAGAVLAALYDC